jgi:hypothetical protein
MPDELDHEVIDSPQALFRHLYEAHGVIEALDLDPDTAPLQFWLRRHSDLERAAARTAAEERRTARTAGEEGPAGAPPPRTGPEPGARLMGGSTEQPAPGPTARPARGPADGATGGSMAARGSMAAAGSTAQPAHGSTAPRPGPATASGAARSPSPQPGPPSDRSLRPGRLVWRNRSGGEQAPAEAPPPAGSGSGPRFRPFTDPLVEAVAVALIGRGLDERRVRRGLSTFTGADRRHGEDAVRATFVVPMLDALAAHLAGNPQNRTQWPPPTWTPSRNAAEERQPRTPDRAGRERSAADVVPEISARETAPPGTPPRTPTPPSSAPRGPAPAAPPRNPVPSSPAWGGGAGAPPRGAGGRGGAPPAPPRSPAAGGRGGFRDRPAVRGGQEGICTAGRDGFRGPANIRGGREGIRAGRRGGVADRAAVGGAWDGTRAGRRLHGDRGRAPGAAAVAARRAARGDSRTGVRTVDGTGVRSNGGARGRGGADRAPVHGGDGDPSDRAAVPCGGRRAGDRAGFGGVAGGVRGVGRRRDGAGGRGAAAAGEPAATGAAVGLQGPEPTVNGGFTSS